MLPDSSKLLEDIPDAGSFVLKITESQNETTYSTTARIGQHSNRIIVSAFRE